MKKHKLGLKFALLLVGAMVVGGVMGVLLVIGDKSIGFVLLEGQKLLQHAAFWLMLAVGAVCVSLAAVWYRKGQKIAVVALAGDGEDEAAFNAADQYYAHGLGALNVLTVLSFVLFGVSASAMGSMDDPLTTLWGVPVFCVLIIFGMVGQGRFIKATKQLYPEKRGSVLDMKFQEKWYESCDEAERRQIGDAALVAMKATGKAVLLLFVVLILLSMVMDIGVLPILTMGTIWLVQTVSYHNAATKGQKKKK